MMTAQHAADSEYRFVDFMALLAQDLSSGQITFPTFVDATLKIRNALSDPDIDAGRLAQIISSEPLLPAKVMRAANSVAFNPSGDSVSDVKTAVIRVGLAMVRTIAVTVSMEQLQSAQELLAVRERTKTIWRHSIDVAAISYVIAQHMTNINPDEALFAGLVHDIGKFYLLSRIARFAELRYDDQQLDTLLQDWHASIGNAVLATMDVPPATLAAVSEHELGEHCMPPRSMVDVVVLANLAAHALQTSDASDPAGVLDEPRLAELLRSTETEILSLVTALRG
jgi:HD-like signal output (HDOD) protein